MENIHIYYVCSTICKISNQLLDILNTMSDLPMLLSLNGWCYLQETALNLIPYGYEIKPCSFLLLTKRYVKQHELVLVIVCWMLIHCVSNFKNWFEISRMVEQV